MRFDVPSNVRGVVVRQNVSTALVLLGGEPIDPGLSQRLPVGTLVVAADSGLDQAQRLGLAVDVAVGDFDSVSAEGLARAIEAGTEIQRHPHEKSATDFELALRVVMARGCSEAVVVGGEGGRLDHTLANLLLMASDQFAVLKLTALGGDGSQVHVTRTEVTISGTPGQYVTLLAVHGAVEGVVTSGLKYPLAGERLEPGSSLGVSNELVGTSASVSVTSGVLVVVQPGRSVPALAPNSGVVSVSSYPPSESD